MPELNDNRRGDDPATGSDAERLGGPFAPDNTPVSPYSQSPLLNAALTYAGRGWYVFPIRPGDKQPLTRHGCHDATTDQAAIRAWWRRWPGANVAVVCGHSKLAVIDVDPRNGGAATWAEIEREHQPVHTLTSLTGGGGLHLVYRVPDGLSVGKLAATLGHGVDVLRGWKYFVAPPSLHPSGRRYQWQRGTRLVELPGSLVMLLTLLIPSKSQPSIPNAGKPQAPQGSDLVSVIKSRLNLVDVALELGIEVKSSDHNSGRWFLARCPFHADHSPSLWIDALRGRWGCYSPGCVANRSGDLINLWSLARGLDVHGAILELSAKLPVGGAP